MLSGGSFCDAGFSDLPDVPQFLRPVADIADNGWLPSTGSDLFAMLDETVADDADYIYSPDNPTTEQAEYKFGPGAGGPFSVCTSRIRLQAMGADTDFDIDLVEASSVLASWTESVTVAENEITRVHVSSGITITDPTDLRHRVVARAP